MWKRTYSHRQQTKHKINYYLWLTKLVIPFKKKKKKKSSNGKMSTLQNNTKRLIFRIYLKMKRKNTWKLPSWKAFWQHTAKNQAFLPLDPTTQLLGSCFMEIASCTRMCTTALFVELKTGGSLNGPKNTPDVYIWTFYHLGKGHVTWKQLTIAFTHVKYAYEKSRSRPFYPCFWDSISKHVDLITEREGKGASFVWHPLGDVKFRSY